MAASSNWKTLQKTLKTGGKEKARDNGDETGQSSSGTKQPSSRDLKRKLRNEFIEKDVSEALQAAEAKFQRNASVSPPPISRKRPRSDLVSSGIVTELDLKRAYGADLDRAGSTSASTLENLLSHQGLTVAQKQPGRYLAIDCEMVGVGFKGSQSVLARVSVVNYHGAILLDRYVKPKEHVTDWRTWISGITEADMRDRGQEFEVVQKEVAELIRGRILVGHAIQNDLRALLLTHPTPLIRDTARYEGSHKLLGTKQPSLKKLANKCLEVDFQKGQHDSVDDAKITMLIYRHFKKEWELLVSSRGQHPVPDPNDPTRLVWTSK